MKRRELLKYLFYILTPLIIVMFIVIKLKEVFYVVNSNDGKNGDLSLTERQIEIYQYIREKGEGRVSSMLSAFPMVVDRTLRRDLNKLEELGLVKRSGSTKSVVYTIK